MKTHGANKKKSHDNLTETFRKKKKVKYNDNTVEADLKFNRFINKFDSIILYYLVFNYNSKNKEISLKPTVIIYLKNKQQKHKRRGLYLRKADCKILHLSSKR